MSAYDTFRAGILGNPFDANKKPSRQETVQGFKELQDQVDAFQSSAVLGYENYVSTSAGIAATTNGESFTVFTTNYLEVYLNNGGTANLQGQIPLKALTDDFALTDDVTSSAETLSNQATSWIHKIEDADGNILTPVADIDLQNDRFWINGKFLPIEDALIANGDGSYNLAELPEGLAGGYTVLAEWDFEGHTGNPSGCPVGFVANPVNLDGLTTMSLEAFAGNNSDVETIKLNTKYSTVDSQVAPQSRGARRCAMTLPNSGSGWRYQYEGQFSIFRDSSPITDFLTPTLVGIGRRPLNASVALLQNANVNRVTIWAGDFTQNQLETMMVQTDPAEALKTDVYPNWLAILDDGNGGKVVPWCQLSQSRNRCWFEGREQPLSDVLKTNGDGTFSFKDIPLGLGTRETGMSVAVDYLYEDRYIAADNNLPSGTLLSMNGSGNAGRFEFEHRNTWSTVTFPPSGVAGPRTYIGHVGDFWNGGDISIGSPGVVRDGGVRRQCISIPSSGNVRGFSGTFNLPAERTDSSGDVNGEFEAPINIDIGRRSFDNGSLSQNVTLDNLIIYDQYLTIDQLWELKHFNEYGLKPLFFYGDSLNNVGPLVATYLQSVAHYGYIPAHTTGQGGRGLNFHKDFIQAILTAYPKLSGHIPIIIEGGLDRSGPSYADAGVTEGPFSDRDLIQFYRDILDMFSPNEAIILSPNQNPAGEIGEATTGTTLGDTWVELYGTATDDSFQAWNVSKVPALYKIASSTPSDNSGAVFLGPGEFTDVDEIVVAGSTGENLYAKSAVVGSASSIHIRSGGAIYVQFHQFLEKLKNTFPEYWCDWTGLMQAEYDSDVDYENGVKWGKTPTFLRGDGDNIHPNWTKTGTTNEPGGSHYIGQSIAKKLASFGYNKKE